MDLKVLVCRVSLELLMEEMVHRMPWARGEVRSRVQSWVTPVFKGQGSQRGPRRHSQRHRRETRWVCSMDTKWKMCLKKEGMVKIFSWRQSKIKTEKRPLTWATILAPGDSGFHRKWGQKPDYNVERKWAVEDSQCRQLLQKTSLRRPYSGVKAW